MSGIGERKRRKNAGGQDAAGSPVLSRHARTGPPLLRPLISDAQRASLAAACAGVGRRRSTNLAGRDLFMVVRFRMTMKDRSMPRNNPRNSML